MIRVYTRRCAKMGQRAQQSVQHETAWALLYDVLREEYGIAPDSLTLAYTDGGKPYFVACPVHFSLSHTPHIAVLAIGDSVVGVDAEPTSRKISAAVRHRFLQDCEPSFATAAWTVREAYGKMQGDGFFAPETDVPHHFETLFAYGHIITVCSTDAQIAKEVLAF